MDYMSDLDTQALSLSFFGAGTPEPIPAFNPCEDRHSSRSEVHTPEATNSGGEEVDSPPARDHEGILGLKTNSVSGGDSSPKSASREEPADKGKPGYSYIALISMAILDSPDQRLLLGEIYSYIADKFPYYGHCADNAWKNSIRHNLSLNECFIKNGRADNGKGNFWSIHPACVEDFRHGDFRRRQARRRAKRCTQSAEAAPNVTVGRSGSTPHQFQYHPYAGDRGGYIPMRSCPTSVGLAPPTATPYGYPMTSYPSISPSAAAAAYLSAISASQISAVQTGSCFPGYGYAIGQYRDSPAGSVANQYAGAVGMQPFASSQTRTYSGHSATQTAKWSSQQYYGLQSDVFS